MCGRFVAFSSADEIADRLALSVISQGARLLPPNWNVAPTQPVRVITPVQSLDGFDGSGQQSRRSSAAAGGVSRPSGRPSKPSGVERRGCPTDQLLGLEVARWGLQTPWNKPGSGIINARVESVADKPSFSSAFASRRCIVPTNGYYEWQKTANGKQPWFITGLNETLYFAGIFNGHDDDRNVAIITMPASSEINDIHHRMPVSFSADYLAEWIYGSPADALALLHAADQHFTKWHVSTRVNSVRNNGPDLIAPASQLSETLF